MAIVVNQHHLACRSLDLAQALEAAIDAFEVLERGNDRGISDLQFVRDGNRRQRVTHVVHPGQAQRDVQRLAVTRTDNVEARQPR